MVLLYFPLLRMRFVESAVARITDTCFELMIVTQNGQLEESGRILLNHYRDDQIVGELISAGEIKWLCEDVINSHDRWPPDDEPERPGWEHERFWPYRFRTLIGMIFSVQKHTGCRHVYVFDGYRSRWHVCSREDAFERFGPIRPLDEVLAELD